MERLVDRTIGAAQFTDDARSALPARARIVIVGGGIVGASIAHHLALAVERDVLLLEANTIGSGTTWHAAGLVTGARSTAPLTQLALYSNRVFEALEEKSGVDVNWTRSGSLSLARTDGRADELQYQLNVARQAGLDADLIGPDGLGELWPLASPSGIISGLHLPGDGHVNPGYAGVAFAKLAHEEGVGIREGVRVEAILTRDGRATGVRTEQGDVEADVVIVAAGLWSRDLAEAVGASVPLYAAEHVHVRTNPIEGAHPHLPVLRDLDSSYYIRHEDGRLLVGAFEPDGKPRRVDDITTGGFAEFAPDWDHFSGIREKSEQTVPAIADAGLERFLNAPESFTPDANFMIGETGEVHGLYVAAGMNSQGIIFAPAIGRELAAWVISGAPQFDSAAVDVRRFSRHQANRRYLHKRTQEGLGRLYAMHWPGLQPITARNVRRTPLHERLAVRGAAFGEQNGWERANWFEEPGTVPSVNYSYRRASWFPHVALEHRAARESVAIFDMSSFAKFHVVGADALSAVQRTFTSNLDVDVNRAVYTLALNASGGVVLDATVTRLAPDRFVVVVPAATQDLTASLLNRAVEGSSAVVFDATAAFATMLVTGPRSRELLQRISPSDWSDEAIPFLSGAPVEIADGFGYALRVSFAGELGYEITVSSELAVNVFDALWEEAEGFDARLAGYYALDTLRSEKGYRHLGHDMGPIDDPRSAGLWYTVDLAKGDFVGRDAIAHLTPADRSHRMIYFLLGDPEPVLVHDETVFRDGVIVGRATSGNYGHTLGAAVGLAAIDLSADLESGTWEIECGSARYPITVSSRPLYDPSGARLRG